MHSLGAYQLKFTSRRAWTAEVRQDGKLVQIAPVTWIKDISFRGDDQYLNVWVPKSRDPNEYASRSAPFIVAVAEAQNYTQRPRKFVKFVALYRVEATGITGSSEHGEHTVETRVLERLDRRSGRAIPTRRKISRISYNSLGWRQPTGEAAESEATGTYNSANGFGHEDWLFRDEWTIAGWRYAFLQGVNKSRAKLLKAGEPFDVTLFTVQPDKKRRYVASIREVECLDESQSADALKEFKKRGWLKIMKDEITAVNGNANALGDSKWAVDILNVRFRLDSVSYSDKNTYAGKNDHIMGLKRYSLYDDDSGREKVRGAGRRRKRAGATEPLNTRTYRRRGTGSVEVSPEEAKMQQKLVSELRRKYPGARILFEEDYIDVLMETKSDRYLFEIKSDLSPRKVLRQAIGQLLEYAYYNPSLDKRSLNLIAVGRNRLSGEDELYLETVRAKFNLPLTYMVVPLS
jgi:hypothetical protein